MVHTSLPNDKAFTQGVTDTLRLLKVAGIGAQLIVKGIKDPEAAKVQGLTLAEKLKELPLEANEIMADAVVDPLADLIARAQGLK